METTACFSVRDFNLAATLSSGQAFRWKPRGESWEAVIHGRWIRLRQASTDQFEATAALPQSDWSWLVRYLRLNDNHAAMLATFPQDAPMGAATSHCRDLRLLRQEPWECLASFILSSTKQIVQIQQCVELLCERFGEPLAGPAFAFPTAARLAAESEAALRSCKIGFRAKYLLAAACMVTAGELDLARLERLSLDAARAELMRCPGVGRKIADCTLLFSCSFDAAFPIDVWVDRALRLLYFPKRRVKRAHLERFAATHFGPHAGLAQQYLFHYLRTRDRDRNQP